MSEDVVTRFIRGYMDDNLWSLKLFYRALQAFQKHRNEQALEAVLATIAPTTTALHQHDGERSYAERFDELRHVHGTRESELGNLDIGDADLARDMDVLYQCLKSGSFEDVEASIGFILTRPRGRRLPFDAYDCIFACFTSFITKYELKSDVGTYYSICRDLFYFKCLKKLRASRVRVLLLLGRVIHQREPRNVRLAVTPKSAVDRRYDYFFVKPILDPDLSRRVALAAAPLPLSHRQVKTIQIKSKKGV